MSRGLLVFFYFITVSFVWGRTSASFYDITYFSIQLLLIYVWHNCVRYSIGYDVYSHKYANHNNERQDICSDRLSLLLSAVCWLRSALQIHLNALVCALLCFYVVYWVYIRTFFTAMLSAKGQHANTVNQFYLTWLNKFIIIAMSHFFIFFKF